MQVIQFKGFASLLFLVSLALIVQVSVAQNAVAKRGRAGTVRDNFSSKCGTRAEVAKKVGECMSTLFDVIEGKIAVPKTDQDIVDVCNQFIETERCLRQHSRDCLSGLHKTIVGTFASSLNKYRKPACKTPESRAKYFDVYKCGNERSSLGVSNLNNLTAITQTVRDSPNHTPEEKLLKVCCLLKELDINTEAIYINYCPKSTPILMEMMHAVTDDARSALCVNPKCANSLNQMTKSKLKSPQKFIEPVLEIIFMISTSDKD